MPYIPQERRPAYNKSIKDIAEALNDLRDNDQISGELNYVIFCLAKLLCDPEQGGVRNYARMAVVSSAFSEAQAEFRRRVMSPYEDEKIDSAGDV